MRSGSVKGSRGRPKTLSRDHILDVAMQSYWEEGTNGVSINEICRKANVSKPGLYREFGNEDGLMKAVLSEYERKVLAPMLQMLTADAPFRETLDSLVSLITEVDDQQDMPKGCLMVKMRESRLSVGDTTREQIDRTQEQVLNAYKDWVGRAKEKGELSADISSQFATAYIDSQLSNALSQLARGEQNNMVRKILAMAFSVLV